MTLASSFAISMRSHIALRTDQLRLVRTILRSHVPDREVRAFGSRVTGRCKPVSDLDLCVMGTGRLRPDALERLRLAFSESSLPMRVDVVEWNTLKTAFRKIVESTSVAIQPPR